MSITGRKIWRDMAHNRARTLMVVLSIAVGVFALGTIFGAVGVMRDDLAESHQAWGPAHITFWGGPFDPEIEEILLREPIVNEVDRMSDLNIRWKLAGEESWRNGRLLARVDYDAQRLGRVDLWKGQWPSDRTVVIERQAARYFDIPVGATILVQVGRRERRLQVVGIARDPFAGLIQFGDDPFFFTTPETAAWLTGFGVNRIDIQLTEDSDREDAREAIDPLAQRVNDAGVSVYGRWLRNPDEHWFQDDVDTSFVILTTLGGLTLALSAFLIVNTMNAIVSQQVWQIGIMKAIGARSVRVARVYLATALIYGGLALLLAVPLGVICGHLLARWVLDMVNIVAGPLQVVGWAVGLQVVVGLAVPLLAAMVPVIGGTRISVHQAVSTYGLGTGFGSGWFDRLIGRVRHLPRLIALSMRNTFRRKARVVLTMITLVLSGVMFIAVMSVEGSLNNTIEQILHELNYDVSIWFDRMYRTDHLIALAESVPGVAAAEVWQSYGMFMKLPGGGERYVALRAIPPETEIVNPRIVDGRMLLPDDGRAIVLSYEIALDEGIRVGDVVQLQIQGDELAWTVVGLVRSVANESECYVPFDTLAADTGTINRGSNVRIVFESHDSESLERVTEDVTRVYLANNMEPGYFENTDQIREDYRGAFDILLYLLLALATLSAVVGSIGMMGTMSINVFERRREIGVMRAVGAVSSTVIRVFVSEGMMLGLLSWLFAVPLSYPGAYFFSDAVGDALINLPLDFVYSIPGMLLWLVIVILLSTLASLWPALQATRISVREVLAYE